MVPFVVIKLFIRLFSQPQTTQPNIAFGKLKASMCHHLLCFGTTAIVHAVLVFDGSWIFRGRHYETSKDD